MAGGFTAPLLAAAPQAPAAREIKLTGKLLLYPVSHEKTVGNKEGMLSVRVDGALIHNVDGFMAQTKEQVAWWAYLEMDEYVGKRGFDSLGGIVHRLVSARQGRGLVRQCDRRQGQSQPAIKTAAWRSTAVRSGARHRRNVLARTPGGQYNKNDFGRR